MKKLILPLVIFLSFIFIPFVFAFDFYDFYPSDLLENEYVFFALMFVVFFALVFFSLKKTFKGNVGATVVIAICVALAVAAAISQRIALYNYFGEDIGNIIIIVAIVLVALFLIKAMSSNFSVIGFLASLFILWFVFHKYDPSDLLGYSSISDTFLSIYRFLGGYFILVVLVIVTVLCLLNYDKVNRKFGRRKRLIFEE